MEHYLNSHEFFDEVWSAIPEDLVSNQYMDENIDFIRSLTFTFYEDYSEDRVTVNLCAKILTNVFRTFFQHKPLLCNVVDEYLVNNLDEDD